MLTTLPRCVASRLDALPTGLRDHVERVRDIGRRLALRHGVDAGLVDLGLAAHDLARHLDDAELLRRAEANGIVPTAVERSLPVLLHGPVAAAELEREGLADGRPDGLATGREWRTPPLWGIGLVSVVNGHTMFLHDGRARSIEEAILWHGGEGQASRDRFTGLTADERDALLQFLRSL